MVKKGSPKKIEKNQVKTCGEEFVCSAFLQTLWVSGCFCVFLLTPILLGFYPGLSIYCTYHKGICLTIGVLGIFLIVASLSIVFLISRKILGIKKAILKSSLGIFYSFLVVDLLIVFRLSNVYDTIFWLNSYLLMIVLTVITELLYSKSKMKKYIGIVLCFCFLLGAFTTSGKKCKVVYEPYIGAGCDELGECHFGGVAGTKERTACYVSLFGIPIAEYH